MSGKGDSSHRLRRIDAPAKAAFLAGLRRGERREDAAEAAGFSLMGFYGARGRDPAFKAGWTEALATSAAAERRVRAYSERGAPGACPGMMEPPDEAMAPSCRGEVRIAAANRRFYQRRRRRNVRFDAAAQAAFLAHFAATCDTRAAAAQAGVSESTVHLHRRSDPAFAEAYAQALAQGYVLLEAEAVRQRLAAQAKLRAAVETADAPLLFRGRGTAEGGGGATLSDPAPCPTCGQGPDSGAEFDRIMKLLARHDRKPRRVDSRFKPGGRRHRWTFDEAITALDRRLRALGARTSGPAGEEEEAD